MSPSIRDKIAGRAFGFFAWISAGVTLLIVVWIGFEATPAFKNPGLGKLLGDAKWLPGSNRAPQFGVLPLLAGSLFVTIVAILPASFIGVSCAVFQRFYAPRWLSNSLRRILELLAGIPSVVIGFWGLVVVVPLIQKWQPPGQSLFAAGVVLALMILPTVALTASSAIRNVPHELFQSAAALGIDRPRTILGIAIPAARRGIGAGIILAAARAIGETMAVIMVCGNIPQWPSGLFEPIRPVTSTIALEMGYATSEHRAVLFATGFFLVLLVGAAAAWIAFSKKEAEA